MKRDSKLNNSEARWRGGRLRPDFITVEEPCHGPEKAEAILILKGWLQRRGSLGTGGRMEAPRGHRYQAGAEWEV